MSTFPYLYSPIKEPFFPMMKQLFTLLLMFCTLVPQAQAQLKIPKVPPIRYRPIVPPVKPVPISNSSIEALIRRLRADRMKATLFKVERSQWNSLFGRAVAFQQANLLDSALWHSKRLSESTLLHSDSLSRLCYISSMLLQCNIYQTKGDYGAAYLLAKQMLKEKLRDGERELVYYRLAYNGYRYAVSFTRLDSMGRVDYPQARALLEDILPYANDRLRPDIETKVPLYWYFEASAKQIDQRYEEALTCYRHALEGFHALGRYADEVHTYRKIAIVHSRLVQNREAQQHYKQALALTQQYGLDSLQMETLIDMWKFGRDTEDLPLTRACAASMDSLFEQTERPGIKYNYYLFKGDEAYNRNQHKAAEGWYLKAEAVTGIPGAFSPQFSPNVVYSKLENLYSSMGQLDDAIWYARKNMEDRKRYLKSNSAQYYDAYMGVANLYAQKGDTTACEAYLDSLFIGMNLVTAPRVLSLGYSMRGLCYSEMGRYASALADYMKADSILTAHYPETDESRVSLLPLLGGMEHKMNRYDEAERLYRRYADLTKVLYGETSQKHVEALTYAANASGFADHLDDGCQAYTEAMLALRQMIKARSPYMTADERESFWEPLSPMLTSMTPYAIRAERCQTPFTASCYDALLMSKAFLLESERSLADVVRREGTADDEADFMRLSWMKKQMIDLERNYAQNADSILALSRQADRLAVHLANRCRSFADITSFLDVDYASVKRALKPGEILLDFTDYVHKVHGRQYAAYVIRPDDAYPLLKHLFGERQVDSLGIVRPDMFYDTDYAPDFLRLAWDPLKTYVPEGSTVYYVPSQLFFQVALESLPLPDGSLLGSHYRFVRLSSARQLVRTFSPSLSTDNPSAVLYGGLQYDLSPETMVAQAQQHAVPDLLAQRSTGLRGDSLNPLPGTRIEVMTIDSILQTNHWQVQCRMAQQGTEESFLSMHGQAPRVLQIATHGFYYTPDDAESVNYLKGYTDAMSLSGIVLSGANAAWRGRQVPKGVQDGIVTGTDIARMDLSATDMVVLSVCQSAQGRATAEGLYGLQRAFKKAGVGTMVMTLWKVNDAVTCEFMKTFYERLASAECRWNKHQAFEQAKRSIRARYPDPSYWAAFVMLD